MRVTYLLRNRLATGNARILPLGRRTPKTVDLAAKRGESRLLGVIDCLSIGDLAPTESRGDSGQNCLYDMSIVGNA